MNITNWLSTRCQRRASWGFCFVIKVYFLWCPTKIFALKTANGVAIAVPFFLIRQLSPKWNPLFFKTSVMKLRMASVGKSNGSS